MVSEFRLSNGFNVGEMMELVEVDFVYNLDEAGEYTLLNDDMYGVTPKKTVDKLKEKRRVIVIESHTMTMRTYNIDENDIIYAMLNMESTNSNDKTK